MTQSQAFLKAILAHPDDDAPRLIFADWLEEQGDPASVARAEFIRVQCALASGQFAPQRRDDGLRREQQILNEWEEEWVLPVRRFAENWGFKRGFIHYDGMADDRFLNYAGRLFRRAPVQHLRLWPRVWPQDLPYIYPPDIAALAENKHLRRLHSLDLSGNQLESRHLRALLVSEHLSSLTELNLSSNRIGDSGIRSLAASPLLGRLEHLNLRENDFGPSGLRALALSLGEWEQSPAGLRLQRLELSREDLSTAAQRVIADSPVLRRLVCG